MIVEENFPDIEEIVGMLDSYQSSSSDSEDQAAKYVPKETALPDMHHTDVGLGRPQDEDVKMDHSDERASKKRDRKEAKKKESQAQRTEKRAAKALEREERRKEKQARREEKAEQK